VRHPIAFVYHLDLSAFHMQPFFTIDIVWLKTCFDHTTWPSSGHEKLLSLHIQETNV